MLNEWCRSRPPNLYASKIIMRAKEFLNEQSGLTFRGFPCTKDCSGHAAGYAWAKRYNITDSESCPINVHNSFHEGCVAYAEGRVKNTVRRAKGFVQGLVK